MTALTKEFQKYLSLVKFSHTVFALPFALIGYSTAIFSRGYEFDWQTLILIIVCMVLARNAAMGFNRYIDRHYDGLNPRTANREIPSKILSSRNVLIFVIINSVGFIIATWFLNYLCFFLSPLALLVILGYSYTKRFTWLCHIILGMGLALAPVGAYMAVSASFDLTVILYSIIVLFWVAGFDILYAINDKEFDESQMLYSIPAFFGTTLAKLISVFFHTISTIMIFVIAHIETFGFIALSGSLLFILLLIFQHIIIHSGIKKLLPVLFLINGMASIFLSIGIIIEMIIFYY